MTKKLNWFQKFCNLFKDYDHLENWDLVYFTTAQWNISNYDDMGDSYPTT